jgi:hypothetical protein
MLESSKRQSNPEKLVHRPGEIVIGITTSPEGNRCIGMTYNNEEWLLLTSKSGPLAHITRKELKSHFGVESILGAAIDREQSLNKNAIVLIDPNHVTVNGIYVKPQDFDELNTSIMGL